MKENNIKDDIDSTNRLAYAIRTGQYDPTTIVEHCGKGHSLVKNVDKKTGKTWNELRGDIHFIPTKVCICGSTRFADLHAIKRWELEKTGKYICLMINYLPTWYAEKEFGEGKNDHFGEASGLKEALDDLHFRKIDMSDEVFVINKDGYIGESTRNEIEYAKNKGKKINYLEPIEEK